MARTLASTRSTATTRSTTAARYYHQVLQDGPIAYWRLNEASGAAIDSSGNNKTTTVGGSPTYSQTSPLTGDSTGKAVAFPASSAHFDLADDNSLDVRTGSFTVEYWLKTTQTTTGTAFRKNDSTAGGGGIVFTANRSASSGLIDIRLLGNSGTVAGTATSTVVVNDGSWYHIAGVVDRTNALLMIYVNGAQSGVSVSISSIAGQDINPSAALQFQASSGTFLNCTMAEVALYAKALTASQVQKHYLMGTQSGKRVTASTRTLAS